MKTFLARFAIATALNIAIFVAIKLLDVDRAIALGFFVGLASWSSVVSLTSAWEKE